MVRISYLAIPGDKGLLAPPLYGPHEGQVQNLLLSSCGQYAPIKKRNFRGKIMSVTVLAFTNSTVAVFQELNSLTAHLEVYNIFNPVTKKMNYISTCKSFLAFNLAERFLHSLLH